MFRLPSGRACLVLLLVAAVAVSGCSVFGKKKKPTLAYEEHPVDLLYNAGATRLDQHQWNEAVDYFREVERQHPYSEWARRSILMTAYAHYQANDYAEAIADSDQFISLYPGNPSTPYAYYLKAICYFEQIVDVGRDQASTSAAGEALREVAKRYPYSEYAADARLKIDMVQDQLAGKEMTIGRYYLRAGDPMGAITRFRTVVDKYQTTSHTPEALYRLVEAYLTVGLIGEAQKNGAVLGYNYPGDAWYQAAYHPARQQGLPARGRSPTPRGAAGRISRSSATTTSRARCRRPERAPNQATPGEPDHQCGRARTASQRFRCRPGQHAHTEAPPPKKQTGLIHGVLGL